MGMTSIPIKPLWHFPKMPVLTEEYKNHWRDINSEPHNLGICWGANVIYYRYPVRNENGTMAIFQYMWRDLTFLTVETDYYDESQMKGVWLDVDSNGKADEFFENVGQLVSAHQLGNDGLCPIVKHVLDYWR